MGGEREGDEGAVEERAGVEGKASGKHRLSDPYLGISRPIPCPLFPVLTLVCFSSEFQREKRRKELLEKAEEKKRAEDEAAKKLQEAAKAAVAVEALKLPEVQALPSTVPAPDLNKENEEDVDVQDDASEGSSSGISTPAEVQTPTWVKVSGAEH